MALYVDMNPCPICGGDMMLSMDNKPIEWVNMNCDRCGFEGTTKFRMLPNDRRIKHAHAFSNRPVKPLTDANRRLYWSKFKKLFRTDQTAEGKAAYLGLPSANSLRVVVGILNGVVYVDNCPAGVKVKIVNHDNTAHARKQAKMLHRMGLR